jgi:hypothetical protein
LSKKAGACHHPRLIVKFGRTIISLIKISATVAYNIIEKIHGPLVSGGMMKKMDPMLRAILVVALLAHSWNANTKDVARPESFGGEGLIELTAGVFFIEGRQEPSLGVDLEFFIPGTEHHFSLGVAADVEWAEHFTEYYFGPLVSAYFYHWKFFWTSGVAAEDFERNLWKHRLGLGYEIIGEEWVYVPSVAYDFVEERRGLSIIFGVAHEF